MKTWITAAALGAAMLGGLGVASVQAQTPPPPPAPMQQSDADGDGVVTRDEAAADADRRFAAMDTNHDGKLTRDERRTWREQRRAPPPRDAGDGLRRDRRDTDQTQTAFRDRALKRFDRIDTNHDGRIDATEREAMMMLMRSRGLGHERRQHGKMPPPASATPIG